MELAKPFLQGEMAKLAACAGGTKVPRAAECCLAVNVLVSVFQLQFVVSPFNDHVIAVMLVWPYPSTCQMLVSLSESPRRPVRTNRTSDAVGHPAIFRGSLFTFCVVYLVDLGFQWLPPQAKGKDPSVKTLMSNDHASLTKRTAILAKLYVL